MNFLKNKKAEGVAFPTLIFIILNITFFVLLFIFVFRSAEGAAVYEPAYAKEIALMIDSTEPGMTFALNVSKGIDIAKEKGKIDLKNIIKINEQTKRVEVNFANSGGYSFQYFSRNKVLLSFDEAGKKVILNIFEDKENE